MRELVDEPGGAWSVLPQVTNTVAGRCSLRGESSRLRPALTVAAACREVAEGPRGEPVGDPGRWGADASVLEAIAGGCLNALDTVCGVMLIGWLGAIVVCRQVVGWLCCVGRASNT